MSKPMNICMDCVNNFFDKKKNRYYCADKKTRIEDVPCEFFEQRCDDDIDNPWHTGTPTEGGMYLVVTDIGYDVWEFNEDFKAWHLYFDNFKAWQKIEPYKGTSK